MRLSLSVLRLYFQGVPIGLILKERSVKDNGL